MLQKIGVYGKVASQPDFLRVNAGAFSQAGLDRWLADGLETVRAERTTLPAEPTGFLLAPPAAPVAFVGAFAPSADASGRSFVLAVFAEIAREGLADSLPSLPSVHAAFVRAAGEVASSAATVAGADIAAHAQALASSTPSDEAPGAGLADAAASSLIEALAGGPAALAYACRTMAAACDQAAKGGGAITVDAPAPTPAARQLWLEIARRRVGGRDAIATPLWTDGADGRLLLTLGPPSPSALSYLANRRHRSNRLWPLRTEVASAVAEAESSLTAQQRAVIASPLATFADLAAAFTS